MAVIDVAGHLVCSPGNFWVPAWNDGDEHEDVLEVSKMSAVLGSCESRTFTRTLSVPEWV